MAKAKSNKMGRPSTYTPELGQEIANAIASSELGLIHIVNQNPHWPDRATIFKWRTLHKDFGDMYARAKEEQMDVVVEYMQELMSEPHKFEDPTTGREIIDVPMLRLKMDTMKWHASKLKRKKYGDDYKNDVENTSLSQATLDHEKLIEKEHQKDH